MRGLRIQTMVMTTVLPWLSACDFDGDDRQPPMLTAPAPLANGIVGSALTPVTFTATGSATISYRVTAGLLPPGTSLDAASGVYSGTPTAAGSFSFTVTASNSKGSDSEVVNQTVLQLPMITAPAAPLQPLTGGDAASSTFVASGSAPVSWSVSAGALPPGMTLDAGTGVYAGTPSVAGGYSFTVTASNAAGSDSDAYTQTVVAPAVNAQALLDDGLAAFATSFPAGLEAPVAIAGVNAGDAIVSIDRRPQNGFLYGLGYNAAAGTVQLYALSGATGQATPVGAAGSFVAADGSTPVPVGAGPDTVFGMDFNPTVDRIRVVNSAGQNFRMNPNNGAFVDGNTLIPGINLDGGINGATTSVQETAYTNNSASATVTTQYTMDRDLDTLCIQNPPNAGTQTQCLPLVQRIDAVLGFDIPPGIDVSAANTPAAGSATAVVRREGETRETLARIDLTTGALTSLGTLGSGGVRGLALQRPLAPAFVGLGADGLQLLRFSGAAPGNVVSAAISGVAAGEVLVGIDYRPQTGQLYSLGVNVTMDAATLYLLDPQTGSATAVGAPGQIRFVDAAGSAVPLTDPAEGYGFDFNPTVDRIRVTSSGGLNFRVNPNNGAPVDGNLNLASSPPDGINTDGALNGLPPGATGATGAAYTNSHGQSLSGGVTTQYVLDAESNQLFIQNPPNAGTVTAGRALTVDGDPLEFTGVSGFDIPSQVRVTASGAPATGLAFAALMVDGGQRLYAIDLANGRATDLGAVGAALSGLAVGQTAVR